MKWLWLLAIACCEVQVEQNFNALVDQLTPEIYERFKCAVEIRKWPDGRSLTDEQVDLCLEAIIRYEESASIPKDARVGYIDRSSCRSKK